MFAARGNVEGKIVALEGNIRALQVHIMRIENIHRTEFAAAAVAVDHDLYARGLVGGNGRYTQPDSVDRRWLGGRDESLAEEIHRP